MLSIASVIDLLMAKVYLTLGIIRFWGSFEKGRTFSRPQLPYQRLCIYLYLYLHFHVYKFQMFNVKAKNYMYCLLYTDNFCQYFVGN